MSPTMEELDCIKKAQTGDAAAFGALVAAYQRPLFCFLLGYVRETDVADDLTQETLIRAWRALPGYRGESSFQTWLFQIGLNRARSWGRWRALRRLRELAFPAS